MLTHLHWTIIIRESMTNHNELNYLPLTLTDDAQFIDLIWKFKLNYERVTGHHIKRRHLIQNPIYRHRMFEQANQQYDKKLTQIVDEIRLLQARFLESTDQSANRIKQPSRKLNLWVGMLTLSLLLISTLSFFSWQLFFNSYSNASVNSIDVSNQSMDIDFSNADINLRIHGSNTIGEILAPQLAKEFFESKGMTETTTLFGDTLLEKEIRALNQASHTVESIEIQAYGSATAFKSLNLNRADIGMASRRIKKSEVKLLENKYGSLRSSAAEHVIALDGLAIIVHPSNPINELNLEQLASLFSGSIRNWKQVGGQNSPVTVYSRDNKSGTWDTFNSLVLNPMQKELHPFAIRIESSSLLSEKIRQDIGGIGFIGLAYANNTKLVAISETAAMAPVFPTSFTIANEDYPLARRLYLYLPIDSRNPIAQEFVNFTLSKKGQSIVEQLGFVGQNIRAQAQTLNLDLPSEYTQLLRNSKRLSTSFRFENKQLDNKAIRDLERLSSWLAEHPSSRIKLLGFVNDSGDETSDIKLSKQLVLLVSKEMSKRGVYINRYYGLGSLIKISEGSSDQAMLKNQRVEIWID